VIEKKQVAGTLIGPLTLLDFSIAVRSESVNTRGAAATLARDDIIRRGATITIAVSLCVTEDINDIMLVLFLSQRKRESCAGMWG
jgi:hypothetical protein